MTGRHLALFTLLAVAAWLPAAWSPADEPAKVEKPAADSMIGNEAGDVRDDNGLSMKLVWCPPGSVTIGHNAVRAILTSGYWLGRYEVTQAEWTQVMGTSPWVKKREALEGNEYAVNYVSWVDAMDFCRKLTAQERQDSRLAAGWQYTLPTEAQWERACRALSETRYCFGDDASQLGEFAWFSDNTRGERYPHRVGGKKPNDWGLYDMHGNVWEWCRDAFVPRIPGGRDPEVTISVESGARVNRGGSWMASDTLCPSDRRSYDDAATTNQTIGFRVALCRVQPAK